MQVEGDVYFEIKVPVLDDSQKEPTFTFETKSIKLEEYRHSKSSTAATECRDARDNYMKIIDPSYISSPFYAICKNRHSTIGFLMKELKDIFQGTPWEEDIKGILSEKAFKKIFGEEFSFKLFVFKKGEKATHNTLILPYPLLPFLLRCFPKDIMQYNRLSTICISMISMCTERNAHIPLAKSDIWGEYLEQFKANTSLVLENQLSSIKEIVYKCTELEEELHAVKLQLEGYKNLEKRIAALESQNQTKKRKTSESTS